MKRIIPLFLSLLLLTGCGGAATDSNPPSQTHATIPTGQSNEGFGLGNIMPPMSVTTSDGETAVLGEVLQEKKLVVLNFWYADCIWCQREFPALELAYSKYQQDVEIFALNPQDEADVANRFWDSHDLTIPMGTCSRDMATIFGVNGYPTSVFIDREGRIALIHGGALTDPNDFYRLFDRFLAEDYTSQGYESLQHLLGE